MKLSYFDDFVKSPSAALRCILSHCNVQQVRLIPSNLRALHLKLFTLSSESRLFTGRSYFTMVLLVVLFMSGSQSAEGLEADMDYLDLPAFKIVSLPKGWFDTIPVYKEPKLMFYTQEFTYTCTHCHEKDLSSEPKKSHLPFGAHKDMYFTHGLNLRCLNCHHVDYPDAFTDHDGGLISKDEPVLLCRKCHGVTYRDWKAGIHGRINSFWNSELGPQKNLACNQCHNPHHPKFPALKPMAPPVNPAAQAHEEDSHHE